MADARRLVEAAIVPQLAGELAAQINAGVGNRTRLVELGMVPRMAAEVAASIGGTANVGRLVELGLAGVTARELAAQIGVTPTPTPTPTYLPAGLGTPMFAVGTRKMLATATEAMRVRATVGGADTAVGFVDQEMDKAAGAAVAAKALVQQWSDQTGNGKHLVNDGTRGRPRIEWARTDYVAPPIAFGYDDVATGLPMDLSNSGLTGDRRNCSIYVVVNPRRSGSANAIYEARNAGAGASLVFTDQNNPLRETNSSFNTVSGIKARAQLSTIAVTYSGTNRVFYMREQRIASAVAPVGTFDSFGLGRSVFLGASYDQTIGDYQAVVCYAGAHTQAEAESVIAYLSATYSVPIAFTSRLILNGDSLTDNYYNKAGVADQITKAGVEKFAIGRPAQFASTIYADRVAGLGDLATTPLPYGAGKTTLVWEPGGNDLSSNNATDADILAITNNMRTYTEGLGIRFVPCTLAGRGDLNTAPKSTYLANYNISLRAGGYTAVADIAAAPGFVGNGAGPNYITDTIHWTFVGAGYAAGAITPTLP